MKKTGLAGRPVPGHDDPDAHRSPSAADVFAAIPASRLDRPDKHFPSGSAIPAESEAAISGHGLTGSKERLAARAGVHDMHPWLP